MSEEPPPRHSLETRVKSPVVLGVNSIKGQAIEQPLRVIRGQR